MCLDVCLCINTALLDNQNDSSTTAVMNAVLLQATLEDSWLHWWCKSCRIIGKVVSHTPSWKWKGCYFWRNWSSYTESILGCTKSFRKYVIESSPKRLLVLSSVIDVSIIRYCSGCEWYRLVFSSCSVFSLHLCLCFRRCVFLPFFYGRTSAVMER